MIIDYKNMNHKIIAKSENCPPFHYFSFDSVNDIIPYFSKDKPEEEFKFLQNYHHYYGHLNSEHSFYIGERSNDEVIYDLSRGVCSNEKTKKMLRDKVGSDLRPHYKKLMKRRKRRSEFDGEFNMDRVMAGEPDFFDVKNKVESDRKYTFYIVSSCNISIEWEDYEKNAVNYIPSIIQKVNEGYQVKIVALIATERLYPRDVVKDSFIQVLIKDFGEQLDFERIANMCQVAFFRKLMFALNIMTAEFIGAKVHKDQGYPMQYESCKTRVKALNLGGNANYFHIQKNKSEVLN